jgi:hypothetical protein
MDSDLLREQKPDLQIASQVSPRVRGNPALLCRTEASRLARWQKKGRRTNGKSSARRSCSDVSCPHSLRMSS